MSLQTMASETRVSIGTVPHGFGDHALPERTWQLEGDTFLMRGEGEHYFRYRRGDGLTVERGRGAGIALEPLWLGGTVHAAIACLNGLVPIHASAVAYNGQVHAFTGASGAGKSTLIAALGRLGLPMVCDDTLVLDPAPDRVMCLPGHKRLKLTPDDAARTGSQAQEPVEGANAKVYAASPAGDVREPLPLASLSIIEDGDPPTITAVTGGGKIGALLSEHYTSDLLAAALAGSGGRVGLHAVFKRMSELAARIAVMRLIRPRDVSRLHESAAIVAAWIKGQGGACQE